MDINLFLWRKVLFCFPLISVQLLVINIFNRMINHNQSFSGSSDNDTKPGRHEEENLKSVVESREHVQDDWKMTK